MIDAKTKEAITRQVDALADELVELTAGMVRIPSVNPTYPGVSQEEALGGETKVNEFIRPLLEALGMTPTSGRRRRVGPISWGALKGTDGRKSLIFNGHVDVVPPGPEKDWTSESGGVWSGLVGDRLTAEVRAT